MALLEQPRITASPSTHTKVQTSIFFHPSVSTFTRATMYLENSQKIVPSFLQMAGKEFHLSFMGGGCADGVGKEKDGLALADLDSVALT